PRRARRHPTRAARGRLARWRGLVSVPAASRAPAAVADGGGGRHPADPHQPEDLRPRLRDGRPGTGLRDRRPGHLRVRADLPRPALEHRRGRRSGHVRARRRRDPAVSLPPHRQGGAMTTLSAVLPRRVRRRRAPRRKLRRGDVAVLAALVALAALVLLPIYVMVAAGFKPPAQADAKHMWELPKSLDFGGFPAA